MYKNKFLPKIFPILQSAGSKPLEKWNLHVKSGCVRKVLDDSIKLSAIEILADNSSDTYMLTPPPEFTSLSIKLPIVVLIVKNVNKFFSFRISIIDDKKCKRTFRIANFQTVTRISNQWCTMPLVLNDGWNIIHIDLNSYSEKAFRTKFVEVVSVQVNASARIRTIYFCDRIYKDEELKEEFKLFVDKKKKVKYIPSIQMKKKINKTEIKQIVENENNKNVKREDKDNVAVAAEVTENKKVENTGESNKVSEKVDDAVEVEEEVEEEVEDDQEEEEQEEVAEGETEEEGNEVEILNTSTMKKAEIDTEHVIYEEVTYENYNNDDD